MVGELAKLFLHFIFQPGTLRLVRKIFSDDFSPITLVFPWRILDGWLLSLGPRTEVPFHYEPSCRFDACVQWLVKATD